MRIDYYLYSIGKYPSRNKATESINKGKVLYKNKPCKPSLNIESLENITFVEDEIQFVSNGGYKLNKAIKDFNLNLSDMVFVDVGASNGGFTDCLLKNNAKQVFAVDVGESQLDISLKNNEKIVVIDNFNARNLCYDTLNCYVDGATCDVSFISLTLVLDGIYNVIKDNGIALLLIKPQFECGKNCLSKSGIVVDKKDRHNAIKKIYNYAVNLGFSVIDITIAPIKEKKNIEYVIYLKKCKEQNVSFDNLIKKCLN